MARRSEERRVGKEGRSLCDWSSDVCSSDLKKLHAGQCTDARRDVARQSNVEDQQGTILTFRQQRRDIIHLKEHLWRARCRDQNIGFDKGTGDLIVWHEDRKSVV